MRIHFARDLGGILQFSFTLTYWVVGTLIPVKLTLWPYYQMGLMKWQGIIMFALLSIMTISSLFRSTFFHPGRIPYYTGDQTQIDWTYCDKCNIHRPPRAHHCRRCGHCVARMDHHCPWINNCVGEDNHFSFMQLVFYTIGLCVASFMFVYLKSSRLPPCPSDICDPESFFVIHERGLIVTQYIMSCVMGIGMVALSCGQHMTISLDVTTLESMMAANPMDVLFSRPERPIRYRYEELCGTKWIPLWLIPCRRRCAQVIQNYSHSQHIV